MGVCRTSNGREGACRPSNWRQDLNVKKITHLACRPMEGRPGYIFEIFENGHIFLKFYFF